MASRLGKPTGHVVGQIVRVVKAAIEQGQAGDAAGPEPKHPTRQTYLGSINRLTAAKSFSAQIVVLQVDDPESAKRCATNCRVLRGNLARTATSISRALKPCHRFPSQEYAASKVRRLRRIGARATTELSEAFAAGKITLRQYDLISRLSPKQQRTRIAALNRQIDCAQIAAKVIDDMLEHTKDVRLTEIRAVIRNAVGAIHV